MFEELYQYYRMNRAVGHTHSIMEGAKNNNSLILVPVNMVGNVIARKECIDKNRFVSLRNLDKLRGQNKPLLIDNSALEIILSSAAKIERENEDLKDEIGEIKFILKGLEK